MFHHIVWAATLLQPTYTPTRTRVHTASCVSALVSSADAPSSLILNQLRLLRCQLELSQLKEAKRRPKVWREGEKSYTCSHVKLTENNELMKQWTLVPHKQNHLFICPSVVIERLIHTREIGMFGPNVSKMYDMRCPCLSKQNLHPDPSPWRRGDAI